MIRTTLKRIDAATVRIVQEWEDGFVAHTDLQDIMHAMTAEQATRLMLNCREAADALTALSRRLSDGLLLSEAARLGLGGEVGE